MKFFPAVFTLACLVNLAFSGHVSPYYRHDGAPAQQRQHLPDQMPFWLTYLMPFCHYGLSMLISLRCHLSGISAADIIQQYPHIRIIAIKDQFFQSLIATMCILMVQNVNQRHFTMGRTVGIVLAFAQMIMLFYWTWIAGIEPLDDAENLRYSGTIVLGLNLVAWILYIIEQL